jgi:hypothetical protein
MDLTAHCVYTNKPPAGPSAASASGLLGLRQQMDEMLRGSGSAASRRRNLIAEGDGSCRPAWFRSGSDCLSAVENHRLGPAAIPASPPLRAGSREGVACSIKPMTPSIRGQRPVNMTAPPSLHLECRMGQGVQTVSVIVARLSGYRATP